MYKLATANASLTADVRLMEGQPKTFRRWMNGSQAATSPFNIDNFRFNGQNILIYIDVELSKYLLTA
ncbi:hypothetical protein RHEC894_PB00027 (plasmid) [Rhizobium sp. CIAT894]|nr:hypothetical protein RHEC894_PB00027 [Rhizobium sp. CIAT894]